jgi:hypothetical protein
VNLKINKFKLNKMLGLGGKKEEPAAVDEQKAAPYLL